MKTLRISEDILQLTRLGLMNCFLVREPDGFTLVDSTLGGFAPQILAAAKEAGAPIRRILLTHAHGDHVGSMDAVAVATGAPAAIGRREARLLAGDHALDPMEPHGTLRGSFPKTKTAPTILLQHGEMQGSLRVISTPGHTPGHLAFLDERSGTLLAGDAVCSVGELRVVTDAPWYFPFPKLATWHAPTALTSVERLASLDIRTIVCGHGHPITDGTRALAAALARCAA